MMRLISTKRTVVAALGTGQCYRVPLHVGHHAAGGLGRITRARIAMESLDDRSAQNSRPTDRRLQGLAGQEHDEPKPNLQNDRRRLRAGIPKVEELW